jgi:hypothetical protein
VMARSMERRTKLRAIIMSESVSFEHRKLPTDAGDGGVRYRKDGAEDRREGIEQQGARERLVLDERHGE